MNKINCSAGREMNRREFLRKTGLTVGSAAFAACAGVSLSPAAAAEQAAPARPLVIAHRGASYFAPENTQAAFDAARELGADGVETDVQLTLDGELVMHHNYTINTLQSGLNKFQSVVNMTLDELRQLDLGSWMGDLFQGQRILTLQECLATVEDFQVVNIELKAALDKSVPYAEPVAQAIRASGYADRVIVSSFDHDLLREMKALLPEVRVGALIFQPLVGNWLYELLVRLLPMDQPVERVQPEQLEAALALEETNCLSTLRMARIELVQWLQEQLLAIKALYPGKTLRQILGHLQAQQDPAAFVAGLDFPLDYLHCNYRSCQRDPELVDRLHAMGVGVNVWTVDEEETMREIAAMGPDGIITNRPDLLLALYAEE